MKHVILAFLITLSLLSLHGKAFHIQRAARKLSIESLCMTGDMFAEAVASTQRLSAEALPASRYIASNRFNVREGAGPKFEKRWAERKSRLATLPGFRFFSLLRRVDGPGSDYSQEGEFGNYISFTVWQDKPSFDLWRTGDAFKEAHGGGGLTGFIQLLGTALFILKGGPKPAFYDGLLPAVSSGLDINRLEMDGGWRKVAADGEKFIDPDSFMVQNKFTVAEGKELAFEGAFKNKDGSSAYQGVPGFVGFYLMRRDADRADDGFNYLSVSIWSTKKSFEDWSSSQTQKSNAVHCPQCVPMVSGLTTNSKPAYFEGKLTIFGEESKIN